MTAGTNGSPTTPPLQHAMDKINGGIGPPHARGEWRLTLAGTVHHRRRTRPGLPPRPHAAPRGRLDRQTHRPRTTDLDQPAGPPLPAPPATRTARPARTTTGRHRRARPRTPPRTPPPCSDPISCLQPRTPTPSATGPAIGPETGPQPGLAPRPARRPRRGAPTILNTHDSNPSLQCSSSPADQAQSDRSPTFRTIQSRRREQNQPDHGEEVGPAQSIGGRGTKPVHLAAADDEQKVPWHGGSAWQVVRRA